MNYWDECTPATPEELSDMLARIDYAQDRLGWFWVACLAADGRTEGRTLEPPSMLGYFRFLQGNPMAPIIQIRGLPKIASNKNDTL